MEIVSLKNSAGDVIEVKRGPDGKILVRHTDLSPEIFAEFTSLGKLATQPDRWEPLAKQGIYTNSEVGKGAIENLNQTYVLRVGDRPYVSEEDVGLIMSACAQLDSEPGC